MSYCEPLRRALPDKLNAGDALTISVRTNLLPGFAVFFILSGIVANAPARQTIGGEGVAVDDTGLLTINLASADTAAWAPARYDWIAFKVDGSGNRTEIAQGEIRIKPNPAGVNPVDTRTQNQRILANLNALIEGKSLDDVAMYKIGGRELTKMPIESLLKWQGVYAAKCAKKRLRSVKIGFGGGRR